MGRSKYSIFKDRLNTLKRRRNFLFRRIEHYEGRDSSRDRAEYAAISWAIDVIESDPDHALEQIKEVGVQQ